MFVLSIFLNDGSVRRGVDGYFFLGLFNILPHYLLASIFAFARFKAIMFIPLQATGLQRGSVSRLLPFYLVVFQLHCVVSSTEFSITNLLRFVSFITSGKLSFIILTDGLTSIFLCSFWHT